MAHGHREGRAGWVVAESHPPAGARSASAPYQCPDLVWFDLANASLCSGNGLRDSTDPKGRLRRARAEGRLISRKLSERALQLLAERFPLGVRSVARNPHRLAEGHLTA